jgi:WD40 repeat protein
MVELLDRAGRLIGLHIAAPGVELGELVFSPDDRLLAGAGRREGTISIWLRGEQKPRAVFAAHTAQVPALTFAGDRLWSGSWDQSVRSIGLTPLDLPLEVLRPRSEAAWGTRYELLTTR